MLLGYPQNHTGATYCMLDIHPKRIILRCDVIWPNKTYGDYLLKKTTKATSYILQDKYEYDKQYHVKIDHFKTEVNTEDVKYQHNINTEQYPRGEEDVHNNIKAVSCAEQENKVKQDHHEEIDKNVIQTLKNGALVL